MAEETKFRWVEVKLQTKQADAGGVDWRLFVKKKRDCPGDCVCALGPIENGKYMIKEQCPHYRQDVQARKRRARMEIACACPPISKV
jgi:hypothetical protein